MNRDPHEPTLLPCEKQVSQASVKPKLTKSQLIRWRLRQLFHIAFVFFVFYVGYRLLAKILTPEVLTVIGIIAGFLILRWITRIVLRIAFTIFSLVFWLFIICAFLLMLAS
ncbi:hypothetical protein IX332_001625 [Porphyromonas levii]|nr:hypothetical protein [Porphyromonas levii]MBR8770255.1 hypothetical protein [Porphyromonas levii]